MWAPLEEVTAGATGVFIVPEATEVAVSSAISGQRLVHLATHGFYLDEACSGRLIVDYGSRHGESHLSGSNPLVMSGIALAEANEGVGIWTAEDVASLDLLGTELVVLSACNTGLGEVHRGQGVLGLRRAFAAAGVQNLMSSLWPVGDQPTAELMGAFYAAYLKKGDAHAALQAAQLEMLAAQRREGDVRPRDWGAFIVAGH